MRKKLIKIAGGGLAGLTTAINLAKAGYQVEVYEKCSKIGEHYKENPQMLPNWFAQEDVVKELEKCNIKINWLNKIEEVEIRLNNQKIVFYGKDIPVGYTVLRGGEKSLEKDLAQQAKNLGVRIITNSPVKVNFPHSKIDIIATGFSEPLTIGYGRVYKGEFEPNKVKVFLNSSYTPTVGYCYFFPHNNNRATIKISKKITEKNINLKENFQRFQKDFFLQEIKEENFLYEFSSLRSFKILKSAKFGSSLLVGEAAGFQDELFRFGIRYAILSGYLALKSIIEGLDYDFLWKRQFLKEFQKIAKVRKIFENLKRKKFSVLPENSKIYIEIEKFKRFWLSKKFGLLLRFPFFYQNLFFNKFFLQTFLKIF